MSKEEKLYIRIKADLKHKFKAHADREGKTMTEILIEYIEWITNKPK